VFDEKDSDKSAIRSLTAFQKAIQPAKAIEPSKGAFDRPPLTAIPFMFAFVSGLHAGPRDALLLIWGQWNDAALTELGAQGIAIRAFIETEASEAATPFANFAAVEGFEDLNLIMPVGFTQRAIQGIALGIDDQGAFEAGNSVFTGVSYLVFRPLLDLMTLASWYAFLRLINPRRLASFLSSLTIFCQTRRRWYSSSRRLQVW
jgi:hypothetical protein